MKNLKKWTKKDRVAALENVRAEEGEDYKDFAGRLYDAMADYAFEHCISMNGVPDGWSCPRSFMEWTPED